MKIKIFSLVLLSIFSTGAVGAQGIPMRGNEQMGGGMQGGPGMGGPGMHGNPMDMLRPYLNKFKSFARQAKSLDKGLQSAINEECVAPFQDTMDSFSDMEFEEGPPVGLDGVLDDIDNCILSVQPFKQSGTSRKAKKINNIVNGVVNTASKLKSITAKMLEMVKEGEAMMESRMEEGLQSSRKMMEFAREQNVQRVKEDEQRMTEEQEYRKQYEIKRMEIERAMRARMENNQMNQMQGEYSGQYNMPPGNLMLPPPPPLLSPTSGSLFDIFVSWLYNGR
ncbi:MAG: hypothetical protein AAB847_00195 [Patescibacteria group bacterium]